MIKCNFDNLNLDGMILDAVKSGIEQNIKERLNHIDLQGQELVVTVEGNDVDRLSIRIDSDNLTDDLRLKIEQCLNGNQ